MGVARHARFCGACGSRLDRREMFGRVRGVCPLCGRIDFEQLKVGAGALVEDGGRLLLIRRGTEPFAGCWSLPAGYVENDEPPSTAVIRETHEETGLNVTTLDLAGVFYFDDDPRGNGILIAYHCTVVGGQLLDTIEATDATFFLPGDTPVPLAGACHDQAIRSWVGSA